MNVQYMQDITNNARDQEAWDRLPLSFTLTRTAEELSGRGRPQRVSVYVLVPLVAWIAIRIDED